MEIAVFLIRSKRIWTRADRSRAMSQHQTVFTIEKTVPAAEAAPTLPREFSDPTPEGAPQPIEDASKHMRRRPLRKLLLIGASLLAVAGASNFGWRYWSVGR